MRHLPKSAHRAIGSWCFADHFGPTDVAVVVVARRTDRLDALAAELRSRAPHAPPLEVLGADLATPAGRDVVARRLADPERPIELLVNNAGLGAATAFAEGDPDRYREMLAVNVEAVVELSHAALGPMLDRGRGWIVNVSSLGGHAPGPGFAVYSATKAFVTSFSESVHEECRRKGVVVTAVCPGATRTEFGEVSGARNDDLPGMLLQTPEATALMPRIARRRLAARVTDRL